MAHGGKLGGGKWMGNWRMEWVASSLHTTSEHGVSSITTADAHTSAASSRLNLSSRRFKWIRQFRRKTNSGFCACAITFQTQSTLSAIPWNSWDESCQMYLYCRFRSQNFNLAPSDCCAIDHRKVKQRNRVRAYRSVVTVTTLRAGRKENSGSCGYFRLRH
jgi:hypothetical protein